MRNYKRLKKTDYELLPKKQVFLTIFFIRMYDFTKTTHIVLKPTAV